MKKEITILGLLALLFTTAFFSSCTPYNDNSRVQKQTLESEFAAGITILTVDSCEYVWVKRGYSGGLSHKGNCKNTFHKK